MSPVEPPIQETAAWLDQAVRRSRELCWEHRGPSQKESGLPEKNGLRALLNFAQGTESTDEVILFIEYQGVRMSQFRRFLRDVANECRKGDRSGDIKQLRRFLGVLMRAGMVQREQLPKETPKKQSGTRGRPRPNSGASPRGGHSPGDPSRGGQRRRDQPPSGGRS